MKAHSFGQPYSKRYLYQRASLSQVQLSPGLGKEENSGEPGTLPVSMLAMGKKIG